MYEKGLLRVITPACPQEMDEVDIGGCDAKYDDEEGHGLHSILDQRASGSPKMGEGTVYLPHSCSEWVIGGREQIEALIADLQAILENHNI